MKQRRRGKFVCAMGSQYDEESRVPLHATMAASALSGMLARIPTHPLDTLKAKLQAHRGVEGGLWSALSGTWRSQGLRGFYAGIGIAFGGAGPVACLYFTTYEVAKRRLADFPALAAQPSLAHFCSGLLAESVSCVLWVY